MGHQDVRITREVAGEALRVAGLDREVELPLERAAQLMHDLDRPVAPGLGHFVLDQMSQVLEDSEVSLDLRLDAGAADFQHHSRPGRELCAMHLGDGRSRIGFTFKVDEDLERRAAERLLDLWQELVEGDRRHLAVQGGEFRGPRR